MTFLASHGDEYEPAPGALRDQPIPDTLKLILMDGPRFESSTTTLTTFRDLRIAVSPDLVSLSVTTPTEMMLGTMDPRALFVHLSNVRVSRDISESTLAIVNGGIQLAWLQSAPRRMEWAQFTRTGAGRGGGMVLEGDVFSPALAARGDDVILAYGRREGRRTSINVGSGKTTVEAAKNAVEIAVPSDVAQIRLASGRTPTSSPWIAWVEGSGEARAVRTAPVKCP
jgi:hypothetical protein